MSHWKRHGLVKFCRQFAAAVVVVTAMAFIGVAIEHSPVSHSDRTLAAPGPRSSSEAGTPSPRLRPPNGELLRQLPAGLSGPGRRGRGGSGSPPNWQLWRNVVLIIVLIALVAAATAGLDQVRRSSRRVRQSARA